MNILKIAMLAFAVVGCWACNDDDGETNNAGGVVPEASKVAVSFQDAGKTVLKNSGVVNIPVVLAEAAPEQVKVAISVKEASGDTIAKEDVDFTISSKVLIIEKGREIGNVEVVLNNDGKTDAKAKIFELQIAGVYGAGKKASDKQSCQVAIVNNAFVEFEKGEWVTYEAAATDGALTADTRFIPLMITGTVSEPCKVVLEVADSTAKEYQHFTLKDKEIVLNPGDQRVMVEVIPTDDDVANSDRKFSLRIKEIVGGNLIIGKNNTTCGVTIMSEEVLKLISFGETDLTKDDDELVLEIPVVFDKAPDSDVAVEVKAKETSTAVAGTDFEITEGSITVPANSKKGIIKVRIIGNNTIEADRVLELVFKAVNGSNTEISETDNLCTIKITNNDFPSFAKELTLVDEDQENYQLAIAIPAVDKDRILKISYENFEISDGTYYTIKSTEINVPANATEALVEMKIGYTLDFPAEIPVLKIKVTEVDGFDLLEKEIGTTVNLAECGYRKMLGAWKMSMGHFEAGGNVVKNAVRTITMVGGDTDEERTANFGKKLICKAPQFIQENNGNKWDCSWEFLYDSETGSVRNLNENPAIRQVPFSTPADIYFDTPAGHKKEIPLIFENNNKITWNVARLEGRGYSAAGVNLNIYWVLIQSGIVMDKE